MNARHPLQLARKTDLRCNRAERGIAEICVGAAELRRVGCIVGFQAKRDFDAFRDVRCFLHRKVQIRLAGSPDIGDIPGQIAERVGGRELIRVLRDVRAA